MYKLLHGGGQQSALGNGLWLCIKPSAYNGFLKNFS